MLKNAKVVITLVDGSTDEIVIPEKFRNAVVSSIVQMVLQETGRDDVDDE